MKINNLTKKMEDQHHILLQPFQPTPSPIQYNEFISNVSMSNAIINPNQNYHSLQTSNHANILPKNNSLNYYDIKIPESNRDLNDRCSGAGNLYFPHRVTSNANNNLNLNVNSNSLNINNSKSYNYYYCFNNVNNCVIQNILFN